MVVAESKRQLESVLPGVPAIRIRWAPAETTEESTQREPKSILRPGTAPNRCPKTIREETMSERKRASRSTSKAAAKAAARARAEAAARRRGREPSPEAVIPTAVIQIQDSPEGPRLYTAKIRPGGRVFFSTHPSVGRIIVAFDGVEPLEGVGAEFDVRPGGPVALTIKGEVKGEYFFHMVSERGPGGLLRLDVEEDGMIDKTGFSVGPDEVRHQQCFLPAQGDELRLQVFNYLDSDQDVEILQPSAQTSQWRVPANDSRGAQFPIAGLGGNLLVRLGPTAEPLTLEAGGTEDVEIIIEPD